MADRSRRWTVRSACVAGGLALALARPSFAQLPSQDYRLVFGDEFSGTTLDTMKWVDSYPWGRTHNHLAYTAPENVIVGGGGLTLRAERRAQGGKPFTSGAISTGYDKFRMNGGYVEARVLLPTTPGSWPAFWGLNNGWPPEADIMEYPLTTDGGTTGYPNSSYHTAYHYATGSGNAAGAGRVNPNVGDLSDNYHVFGMEWVDDTSMAFFLDGRQVSSFTNASVAQMSSMYLIFNYAVGGWPGTPSLAQWAAGHVDETKVDWIRVWEKPTNASTITDWNSAVGSSSWDASENWSQAVPRHQDRIARFGANTSAASAVNVSWNFSRTLGGLQFDTAKPFVIGDGDSGLQLSKFAGSATVDVSAATTAAQRIDARVELHSHTIVTNDSNQALTFAGVIRGDGGLTFEGSGTTYISNNNAYLGDTYFDSGQQGPAVARVTRSRPFGNTGVLNFQGNTATPRLELDSPADMSAEREVPNNINLNGRGSSGVNATVAVQNIGGRSLLSGTISAQLGGSNYIIQSDAGLLTLSGGSSNATGATSLQNGAGGTRTFTLQGAGNGRVTGFIKNGNGTIAIAKSGGGTWTLQADNTYTGLTTVGAGTLAVNGLHIGGAYSIGANGILTGVGTIDPIASTDAVNVSGTLAPGTSIGNLTVGAAAGRNNVVFSGAGALSIEIGANGSADRLTVNGTLDLSSTSDALKLIGLTGAFNGATYNVASFTPGTLSGGRFSQVYLDGFLTNAAATSALGNGYYVLYDDNAGLLRLSPVPEPGALALIAPLAALLYRRRK